MRRCEAFSDNETVRRFRKRNVCFWMLMSATTAASNLEAKAQTARRAIEPLLDPGERLLWCERPGRAFIPKVMQDQMKREFFFFWAPLILIGAFAQHSAPGLDPFPVFAGSMYAVYVLLTAITNIDLSYAVTDRRLYVVRKRPWRWSRQVALVNLNTTGVTYNDDDRGNILIGSVKDGVVKWLTELRLTPFFEGIHSVGEVYELVIAAQMVAQPERRFKRYFKKGAVADMVVSDADIPGWTVTPHWLEGR